MSAIIDCPECRFRYVGRFGEDDYEEIKRIRNWLDTKTNREELLAFLIDKNPSKFEILAARDFGVHPLGFINHSFKRKAISHSNPRVLCKACAFGSMIEQREDRIG